MFATYLASYCCDVCHRLFTNSLVDLAEHQCAHGVVGRIRENDTNSFAEFVKRCAMTLMKSIEPRDLPGPSTRPGAVRRKRQQLKRRSNDKTKSRSTERSSQTIDLSVSFSDHEDDVISLNKEDDEQEVEILEVEKRQNKGKAQKTTSSGKAKLNITISDSEDENLSDSNDLRDKTSAYIAVGNDKKPGHHVTKPQTMNTLSKSEQISPTLCTRSEEKTKKVQKNEKVKNLHKSMSNRHSPSGSSFVDGVGASNVEMPPLQALASIPPPYTDEIFKFSNLVYQNTYFEPRPSTHPATGWPSRTPGPSAAVSDLSNANQPSTSRDTASLDDRSKVC